MQKNIMLFDYPLVFFYVISRMFYLVLTVCGTLILYFGRQAFRQMLNKRLNNDGKKEMVVWIKEKLFDFMLYIILWNDPGKG